MSRDNEQRSCTDCVYFKGCTYLQHTNSKEHYAGCQYWADERPVFNLNDVQPNRRVVQEVKHARWKDGYCTNCGTSKFVMSVTRGFDEVLYEYEGKANYCPNCGAKMDEKEEE